VFDELGAPGPWQYTDMRGKRVTDPAQCPNAASPPSPQVHSAVENTLSCADASHMRVVLILEVDQAGMQGVSVFYAGSHSITQCITAKVSDIVVPARPSCEKLVFGLDFETSKAVFIPHRVLPSLDAGSQH
jgi:hypothetical protein